MTDTTIKKIDSTHSPRGPEGQKYLASGVGIAMRLREAEPPDREEAPRRSTYETVGYVLGGREFTYGRERRQDGYYDPEGYAPDWD